MTSALAQPPESLTLEKREVTEQRTLYFASRPITFDEFVTLFGEDEDVELIDGVVVQKMAAQLDHERLCVWLIRLLGDYVEEHDLGLVLGSRTAVRVTGFRGRAPDLLFIRKERLDIAKQEAVDQAPDLVIELVSSNDRPSDLVPLEADYRSLGVQEIVFIDQRRQTVRLLRREEAGTYTDSTLSSGHDLQLMTLGGIAISVANLLTDPRPPVRSLLANLPPPAPSASSESIPHGVN